MLLMGTLQRIRVTWTNFPGAPGYSNFFCNDADPNVLAPSIRLFFEAIKGLLPQNTTIQYPSASDTVTTETGQIVGTVPVSALTATVSSAVGAFSGSSGGVVHWLTSGFSAGRRVRGRTFLVPLTNGAYDTNGSLSTAALGTLTTAASGLVTAGSPTFVVWARPTSFRAGSAHTVTASSVPDLSAVLRSRRV